MTQYTESESVICAVCERRWHGPAWECCTVCEARIRGTGIQARPVLWTVLGVLAVIVLVAVAMVLP